MSSPSLPFCRLEYFTFIDDNFEKTIKECHDFDQVQDALSEIWESHAKENPSLGTGVVLFNRHGGELEVGMSQQGWLLILHIAGMPQIIFSQRDSVGYVPFLLDKHWYEHPSSCIHDKSSALKAIEQWLVRGIMCLFLVPGRDLGYPYGIS
jgi:hypothetical protein